MAEALSTVAAVVSFVDVTIRACKGVRAVVDTWKEASNTIQRIRQTVQNQQSMLECLRLYVVEYESSKLFVEQHQLLPLVVKNELRDTSSDLDLLLQLLPAAGGQRKMRHQLQWVFDEKKVLAVVSRLDSRQVAVMTGLHITAQRNVISIYNQISSIRNEMQQSHASSLSQLGEAKSSISQQIGEATRYGSDRISEQADMLRSIQTLVEPVAENHANTIDRLGDLVTSTHLSEGRLLSKMALGNISVDSLRRILRTEVPSLIMRIFEEYLNPNKSSQDAQPKGIRESLDRIVSDLGNPLLAGSTRNDVTDNEKPTAGSFQSELSHHSLPHHQTSITPLAKPSRADRRAFTNSHDAAQHWSRLWSRFWTFRWPIGVLRVHISTFHFKVSARRNEYQAYEQCVSSIGRYAYRVSIDFLVAPSLLVARGINLKCENKQDHRGFYQICPMVSTFAVIPLDAEAFSCVKCNDVAGLQSLFENRLAAPTDRTEDGFSLLHVSILFVLKSSKNE
ncbi:MAG: hypothetical protein Q9206_001332 [Seirophora lacunosa]